MRLTDSMMEAILTAAIDTGAPFDPADTWVAVATAITDRGGATAMTDVTPPPGAVATRVPIATWIGPYRMNDGRWAIDGPVARFTPASDADACTLTHWLLADALTAGGLKGFGFITPNITLDNELNKASVVARITLDPDGRWDATVTWNG